MSGFEVVGIVLAAYPILYQQVKDLCRLFDATKTWWRFEREFDAFMRELDIQHVTFEQILQILLEPLRITEDERQSLLSTLNNDLWHQQEIQNQLRKRVQPQYYDFFMNQLQQMKNAQGEMRDALKDIHKVFPSKKASQPDHRTLESEMSKFKTSLSLHGDIDTIMRKIRSQNETIFQFLDRDARIIRPTYQSPKSMTQLRSLIDLQDQARELFECFRENWTCSCSNSHACAIAINKEEIRILINDTFHVKPLAKPLEPKEGTKPHVTQADLSSSDKAVTLRRGGLIKDSALRITKGVSELASSSLSMFRTSGPEAERSAALRNPNKRRKLVRTSENKKEVTAIGVQETETVVEHNQDGTRIPIRPRQVQFKLDEPNTSPATGNTVMVPIGDMCSRLQSQSTETVHGFWEIDGSRIFLDLNPQGFANLTPERVQTFESFLTTIRHRNARVEVALSILRTMLSLGPTAWLPSTWNNTNVHLYWLHDSSSSFKESSQPFPYLRHSDFRLTLNFDSDPVLFHYTPSDHAKATLRSFGILLLELLFGKMLKNHPFLSGCPDQDGTSETQAKTQAMELAAVLQWQKQAEEEFGDVLGHAVLLCITCAFDSLPDLSQQQFVRAVWEGVAQPIEDFLSALCRQPRP